MEKKCRLYLPAAIVVIAVLSVAFIRPFNETGNIQEGAEEDGDIIPTMPIDCKPSHGFDNYRTEQSFVINPRNSSEMYVTVEYKGMYKSSDGGKTWGLAGRGLKAWPRRDNPEMPCYGLHFSAYVDPANPARILLPGGSAPGRISQPMFQTGGLYESTDGGGSWHQLFKGDMNAYTGRAVTDPRNPDIVYVDTAALPQSNAEADPNVIFVTKGVVYKTTDGGGTWNELPTGLISQLRSAGIFINPANPDHLLLGTIALRTGTDIGKKVSDEQWGILQTKDSGRTWSKLESTSGMAIRVIDVSSGNFGHIFISGDRGGEEVTLYSLDGGATFNEIESPVNFARFDIHDPGGMRLLGFSVYFQPDDIFESSDGGKTWNAIGKLPGEVSNEHRASNIVWDPNDRNVVYLNGDMGRIWKSADGGKSWNLLLSLEKLT
ncbi:MAG: hypothetical protein HY365_01885 [Candidatus Aenigmarchaeota archaeon]|nr:hypothetical protein [Candidatus Aenigmarchaeota archaeon]